MSLLTKRIPYKPFEYPWMFDYFDLQNQMHWLPRDVPLHTDVKDWQDLSSNERNLLTQIFRLFTQSDVDVGSGYANRYIPLFGGKPEALQMMMAFGNMESIHQQAYSLLLDTVGMPEIEYKAFAEYEEMSDKHEYISGIKTTKKDKRSIAKTLAVYSAFTEGLQLFSSFAILLNFPRFGRMKGMGQIVTWSIRDESLHVEGLSKLFRTFIAENPSIWTDKLKYEIYCVLCSAKGNAKISILSWRFVQLLEGEDRPVLANEFPADVAATAHADAAFHAVFKRHDDLVVRVAELVQNRLGKFYHDGRPANNGVGVSIGRRRFLFGNGRHETGVVFPVRVVGPIHGDVHVDVVALFPLCQLVAV